MAAQKGEEKINQILSVLTETQSVAVVTIESMCTDGINRTPDLEIPPVALAAYDHLLGVAS